MFNERLVRLLNARMLKTTEIFQVELSDNVIQQLIDVVIMTKFGVRWIYGYYERESQDSRGSFHRFEQLVHSAPGVKDWLARVIKEFITDDFKEKTRSEIIFSSRKRYDGTDRHIYTPTQNLEREMDSAARGKAWELGKQHGIRDAHLIFEKAVLDVINDLEKPSQVNKGGK